MTAREATEEDLAMVAQISAAGFENDPLMRWVFADGPKRLELLRIAFGGLATSFVEEHSVLHVVEDACVAMWRSPSYVPPPATDDGDAPSPFPPDVQERFRILRELMEIAHPHDRPHWYLNVISTLPSHQGRGLGALALRPMVERFDAAGEPAYLESSNPRNMTLYRRHGFEESGDTVDMPDGPSLYPMWREPR